MESSPLPSETSGSRTAVGGHLPVFALVGNPNCGKTTLFNALTGLRQKVGNYPGVTVEKKVGECFSQHGKLMRLIDLPGSYSLAARSPDEAIMRDVLLGRRADTPQPDRVVCVVDASNLERNLYLATQVIELGLPTILVLNMMDLAALRSVSVDAAALERELGVPVVCCEAASGKGVRELRLVMSREALPPSAWRLPLPAAVEPAVVYIADAATRRPHTEPSARARAEALLLLTEQDKEELEVAGSRHSPEAAHARLAEWTARWRAEEFDWRGAIIGARYEAIGGICERTVRRGETTGETVSDRIDAVLVHPFWGWVALSAVMAFLFLSIFSFAEAPMNWIDAGVAWLSDLVRDAMPAGDVRDLLTDGVVAGVGGVVIFLPQILILFFFIGLLESSGYMARAAFIMDRLMSKVGLNGKSFIPLLSSYACAIPGIMSARTIEEPKDRLVTILVAPLMSCSARLPVYLLLIAALFPSEAVSAWQKTGIMFGMYALGTLGAFAFAWVFKRFLLKGAPPLMIMELPPYRLPSLRNVLLHMYERAMAFLRKAGTIILGISILLWALTTYPKIDDAALADGDSAIAHSVAGRLGHAMEPVIAPLGFNWQIGIGLISSFAAREVFVSSMAVVYSVEEDAEADARPLRDALLDARWEDGRAVFTPLVCLGLMVFYVFAMQCISTTVVVRRETGSWRWPLFQLGYMTGFAYLAALVIHQGGRALGWG
ncbi:ferrous iron transport protein B [Opitutales bacterium ASA1]|uniref:ferrous iron transport protein B n=1 Tax=Congregicoccus parvus TaxID=3081749 RepID=UPI002B2A48A7|nr:ferrous iron transport protein B [Opitutales bacterium ASA1]